MENRVCIIVLNWNGKDDTSSCLQSLAKVSFDGEVVIVDNGSTDGSQDHFRLCFPHCTLIETGENLGYAGGNNVGIEYGRKKGYPYFLILNNDTVVDPEIVSAYLAFAKGHPEAGIFGGRIYMMDDPSRFDHFGGIWNQRRIDFDYVANRMLDDGLSYEEPRELDYATGASLFVRSEVFDTIGVFDERFFLFWEETDLCFRARRAGFGVLMCPGARVWHKVSASFTGGKPHASYFFWRNRLLWIERNFSGIERVFYFSRLIVFNGLALMGFQVFRSAQLILQKMLRLSTRRNTERLMRNRACLVGMRDYFFRKFGSGSSSEFRDCLFK